MKKLPNPKTFDRLGWSAFWGLIGYDSSADDYKVISGFSSGSGSTCFQMLTLKTNVSKDVGTYLMQWEASQVYERSKWEGRNSLF